MKVATFETFPISIMVLYEIHQRFKGHFLNELRVSFEAHHSDFLRHTQALAENIDSFITDIDISSKQNFTQLLAHREKYESKMEQVKNIDSKILRLSSPNEKEKEIPDSLICEDKSIEF